LDTACDDDDNDNDFSTSPAVTDKTRAVNAKGLEVLANRVVSMLSLDLTHQVPTKSRDAGTLKLFSISLTLSKAFALITFVHSGKHMPVEKHRDESAHLIILPSAAKYCLSPASLKQIMDSDPDEHSAYIIGLAKNAQLDIHYRLYGQTINFLCDKVLTPRVVHPSNEVNAPRSREVKAGIPFSSRAGQRGFDPFQIRRTKRAFFPPLAI
jgi:hypothetical protein